MATELIRELIQNERGDVNRFLERANDQRYRLTSNAINALIHTQEKLSTTKILAMDGARDITVADVVATKNRRAIAAFFKLYRAVLRHDELHNGTRFVVAQVSKESRNSMFTARMAAARAYKRAMKDSS